MITPLLAVLAAVPVAQADGTPTQEPTPTAEAALSAEAVNGAIDRGLSFLLRSQNRDGSFGVDLYERGTPWHTFRDGASSLALYTMVHCGVPADHPARKRVLAFLLEEEAPTHTYTLGMQLLAFATIGDPAYEERMETLLDLLLENMTKRGWDYPGFSAPPDMSNTQVATLGLWAASKAGLKVPAKAWTVAVETALDHQEKAEAIDIPGTDEKRKAAGFFYTSGSRTPTASITTAGLSILGLALDQPGRVKRGAVSRIEEARDHGIAWLEANYTVEGNPGGPQHWHFYYLYGLERVGALNRIREFAGNDWYRDGALQLLKEQREEGGWWTDGRTAWPPAPMPIANTCFALLFLRRATFSEPGSHRSSFHPSEGAEDALWFRVDAKRKWTMWVTAFPGAPEEIELAVESVEWWVDGELVETVAGDPYKGWTDERFAIQHEPGRGKHRVECRAKVRSVDGSQELELRSAELVIEGQSILEPWMLEYATSQGQNLLAGARLTVTASSQESAFHRPTDAVDGMQGSAWIAKPDDKAPSIRLELRKRIRAKEIFLSPAGASEILRKKCAPLSRLELRINGSKKSIVVDIDNEDPRLKTRVELPRPTAIRDLEIRIVEADRKEKKLVGLAEIELR